MDRSACCLLAGNGTGLRKNGDNTPPQQLPQAKTFTNPLLASGPDPWVYRRDTMYYYTHTLGDRIGLWKTGAMSRLSSAPYTTVYTPTAGAADSRDLWAPELHLINNKWYIYYTAGNGASAPGDPFASQRIFVLENSNTDPTTGNWMAKGRIFDAANDFWAIDGTVLEHNNNLYFLWSGRNSTANDKQNIYIARMSNPWTITGNRVLLKSPTLPWETVGDPDVAEGPQILKNSAGRVFLIYSGSGCWTDEYALGMLTLKDGGDPMTAGDWTKSAAPVFTKNESASVYGPGHNAFFTSRDGKENWIIYHANSRPMNGSGCGNSRSPRMQKFTFDSNGIPQFGTPVSSATALPVPSGE